MRVLIIEDERPAANKLKRLLGELDDKIHIIDLLESVEESVNWFDKNSNVDLIFMDVQLNDGVCFEIFETIDIQTPIIFTTAFNKYAIQAFKVNSIDYLLKPVGLDELDNALSKYKQIYNSNTIDNKLEILKNEFNLKAKERFLVKVGDRYKSLIVDEIICFYIKERSVFINLGPGKNYAIDYSLESVEKMVDNRKFFRVNRNFIINFYSIIDIMVYSSSRLKLNLKDWTEPEEIIVSRERVADFKKWMDR